MRRTVIVLSLAVFATAVLVPLSGLAQAQEPPVELFESDETAPQGRRGHLHAKGNGVSALHFAGQLNVSATGVVWFKDVAGDAVATGSGTGRIEDLPERWRRFRVDGHAVIKGSNVKIAIRGKDLHLNATGAGAYRLVGEGTYVDDGRPGRWPARGTYGA